MGTVVWTLSSSSEQGVQKGVYAGGGGQVCNTRRGSYKKSCGSSGAGKEAAGDALAGSRTISNELIRENLEWAGMTMLALSIRSPFPSSYRSYWPDVVRDEFLDVPKGVLLRPTPPQSRDIDVMDKILGWIEFIPEKKFVIKRVVGARSLVSPRNQRYLFSWQKIGKLLGADSRAVRRWYGQGIGIIGAELVKRRIDVPKCWD